MAKRKNGEGTWGKKTIKGHVYNFFRDETGKYFYGKTQKEVKEKYKEYKKKEDKESKMSLEDKAIMKQTFGDFLLLWIQVKKQDVKQHTVDGYENCINGQLINLDIDRLADVQVGAITTERIQEYYNSLSTKYAKSTIKKNYAILSQCIKYGNKKNLFKEKIDLEDIKLPHEDNVVKKKKEIHFLSEEDLEKLYQESKRINVPGFNWGGAIGEPTYGNNANIIMFIAYTGLRIGEAIDLKWSDVDLSSDVKKIIIKSTAIRLKNRDKESSNKYVTASSSPKTSSGYRIVPLNKRALEILDIEKKLNQNHLQTDYVFATKNGDKIKSRQNVNRTLNNMMKRAGCSINHCTPHELRHSFGSLLLKKGVDIKIVSELLGHKDITVTYNIYIHILNEQKINAVNVLDLIP